MRTLGKVLALAAFCVGCKPPATYSYQYQLTQQFGGAEAPEVLGREARELLANARTVAFYPPDLCLNTDTSHAGGQHQKQALANCGVLLSNLERAAERAGYEVLSWQNLRGQKRPIDYAREANVDVLFEINELDLDNVTDSEVQRTLTFYKDDHAGRSSLQVPQTVAQRCAAYSASIDPVQTAGLTGTIDIKTVAVSDGRDRWHYRKTLSQATGRSYPEVAFRAAPKPNQAASVLGGVGAASIIIGGTLWLVAATSTDDPSTGQMKIDFGDAPTYLIVGGAILAAAGIVIGVTHQEEGSPEDVLCLPGAAIATAAPAPAGPPVAGPMTSQVRLNETTSGDPLEKERERLRDAAVVDFIAVLTEAQRAAGTATATGPSTRPRDELIAGAGHERAIARVRTSRRAQRREFTTSTQARAMHALDA